MLPSRTPFGLERSSRPTAAVGRHKTLKYRSQVASVGDTVRHVYAPPWAVIQYARFPLTTRIELASTISPPTLYW